VGAAGLVENIARPEGNLTVFSVSASASFVGKWVQLLKTVVPQMSRIAMVSDIGLAVPGQINVYIPPIEAAAKEMGIEAVRIAVRTPAESAVAIRAFAEQPNGGLAVLPPIGSLEGPIIRLAVEHKLPSIGLSRIEAEVGTLLAYSGDNISVFRDAATYLDRILRGAKVGDLPVRFPTKYLLIVNLKTAKTIDLEVPPAVLAIADEVIE
jgi:putative tryptophan/tyrosine transport system substrate-binding protein